MPYSSMKDVNPAIKGIKPPVTLAQANHIAEMADSITEVDNPWAVAIANFKKEYKVDGGSWVKGGKELLQGCKAVTVGDKNMLVLWTTNAFKDKEEEIFSTKALQDYVNRRDAFDRKDRAWFWHVKGTDFGTVVWQGLVGRILVEVVEMDNTKYGRKMFHAIQHPEEHPSVVPYGWGTSHGYAYPMSTKVDGVYHFVEKFETTVLPAHRASNRYAGVKEVLEMGSKLTKEKEEALIQVLGDEELAMAVLEETEKATDELEQSVDFKEDKGKMKKKMEEDDEDYDEEDMEEEEDEEKKSGKELDDDEVWELELTKELVAQIAEHIPVPEGMVTLDVLEKTVAGLKSFISNSVAEAVATAMGTKEQVVSDAIAGRLKLKPYSASSATDTVVPGLKDVVDQALKESEKEIGEKGRKKQPPNPVGSVVDAMLSGQG